MGSLCKKIKNKKINKIKLLLLSFFRKSLQTVVAPSDAEGEWFLYFAEVPVDERESRRGLRSTCARCPDGMSMTISPTCRATAGHSPLSCYLPLTCPHFKPNLASSWDPLCTHWLRGLSSRKTKFSRRWDVHSSWKVFLDKVSKPILLLALTQNGIKDRKKQKQKETENTGTFSRNFSFFKNRKSSFFLCYVFFCVRLWKCEERKLLNWMTQKKSPDEHVLHSFLPEFYRFFQGGWTVVPLCALDHVVTTPDTHPLIPC